MSRSPPWTRIRSAWSGGIARGGRNAVALSGRCNTGERPPFPWARRAQCASHAGRTGGGRSPVSSHRTVRIRCRGESNVEHAAGRTAVLVDVTGLDGPRGERPRRAVPAQALGQDADQCRGSLPLRGQFQEGFRPHVGGAGTRGVGSRKSMCASQLRAVSGRETCCARGRWPGRTPGDARGQWRWHPGGPYRVRDCRSSCAATLCNSGRVESGDSLAPCPSEAAVSARVMSRSGTRRGSRPSPSGNPSLALSKPATDPSSARRRIRRWRQEEPAARQRALPSACRCPDRREALPQPGQRLARHHLRDFVLNEGPERAWQPLGRNP